MDIWKWIVESWTESAKWFISVLTKGDHPLHFVLYDGSVIVASVAVIALTFVLLRLLSDRPQGKIWLLGICVALTLTPISLLVTRTHKVHLSILLSHVTLYMFFLFMFISEIMRAGLASKLTKWRGEHWAKGSA
jgi:hypothetical protein